MAMGSQKLEKSIGLVSGTAYCVTIIIGAGILGLPGAAFQLAQTNSVYAWLFDFFLALPLLFVFGKLIMLVQSAGGIADYVKYAFGNAIMYKTSQLILIVTLFAGTAAISIIGAQYLAIALDFGPLGVTALALTLILPPTTINTLGIGFGGTVQKIWAAALISFLLFVICVSIPHWHFAYLTSFDPALLKPTWQAMGLVWFAYTGIEMISFLGEEFESPKKFITAIVLSFLVVGFIYLGLALSVASIVPINDPNLVKSPIVAILNHTIGVQAGMLGGVLGFTLIFINLNAAIMGASRLIFSVGREGIFLPKKLGELNKSKLPSNALWSLGIISSIMVVLIELNHWNIQYLFLLVSQNWFLLYILAILAYIKVETSIWRKALGLVALVFSCAFMSVFSWCLLLPAGIVVYLTVTRFVKSLNCS